MRISLGFVYFHFGLLKFFPDLSPAELLASQTIVRITGGWLGTSDALFYLAIMEVVLGLALIFNVMMRVAFGVFIFHMIGTFAPIVVLPELAFKIFPFAPTIEGQYILKNIVFVAAGWGLLAPHLFARKNTSTAAESTAVLIESRKERRNSLDADRVPDLQPQPIFLQSSSPQSG